MARNKYPGRCYCCGEWIEPGYGHFERVRGGWPRPAQVADQVCKMRQRAGVDR